MIQSNKHKNQDLVNEKKKAIPDKEEVKEDDCNKIEKAPKTEIKNAHASGMGALERSEENINNGNPEDNGIAY